MKRTISKITAFILCLVLTGFLCSWLGWLYMPERSNYGATWNQYLHEQEDSVDVLFVGSSLVYCDIIPAQIYEETGLTSYVLSGPTLTASLEYYYLKEAFRTQSPSIVYLEGISMLYKEYEEYTKVDIGYMPYSLTRLEAIMNAAEKEERFGLLFPLYNYHDLWAETPLPAYFNGRSDSETDINAGYTWLDTVESFSGRTSETYDRTNEEASQNLMYLEKIKALCDANDAALCVYMSPEAIYPDPAQSSPVKEKCDELGIGFIDFNGDSGAAEDSEAPGFDGSFDSLALDLSSDFYDKHHLNFFGAQKFTSVISALLQNSGVRQTHRFDPDLWEQRVVELHRLQQQK